MGNGLIWASLGGAVAGFLICAFIAYPPRCGWDATIDLPAWVQAVGSIAAIIAAALIASKQQRQDAAIRKREADLKAQDAAMLMYEHMEEWRESAHEWLNEMESSRSGPLDMVIQLANKPKRFAVPPEIQCMIGRLSVLGEAGTEVQRAMLMSMKVEQLRYRASQVLEEWYEDMDQARISKKALEIIVTKYAAIVIGAAFEVRRLARVDEHGLE